MIDRKFICMEETVDETENKIRNWLSNGHKIEIISQLIVNRVESAESTFIVTTLFISTATLEEKKPTSHTTDER